MMETKTNDKEESSTESTKGLTYVNITSPLSTKSMVKALAVTVAAGALFAGAPMASSNASAWEDETIEEEEAPTGIELYDNRATTVTSVEGDYIQARSVASPDLFDNIGDGTFEVQWDVSIEPVEGITADERVFVYLAYDSNIDAQIQVERCETRYPAPPNYIPGNTESDNVISGECDTNTQAWEPVDIAASGYIGNITAAEPIGDFLVQNSAYLRIKVMPAGETNVGDVIDSLEIYAEGFGERIIVGNDEGSGRIESSDDPIQFAVPGEDELDEDGNPLGAPNTADPMDEEPVEEPTEPEPAPEPEPEPAPDLVAEEPVEEDAMNTIVMSIIALVLVIAIIAGGAFFLKKRRNGNYEEHPDAGYLDEEEDEEEISKKQKEKERERYSKNSLYFD